MFEIHHRVNNEIVSLSSQLVELTTCAGRASFVV